MDGDKLTDNFRKHSFSQKEKNQIALLLLPFFALVTLFVMFLVRATFMQVKEISVAGKEISQGEVQYYIDSLDVAETVCLAGWAVEPDVPHLYVDCFVLLKDLESGRYYQLKTAMVWREDLAAVFNMESARTGGFQARGHVSKFDPTTTYQVYLLYFDKLVETNYQFSLSDYID